MSRGKTDLLFVFKCTALMIALFAILLQISVQTVAILSNSDFDIELSGLDVEEESEEKEHQEDNSEEEKIEFKVIDSVKEQSYFVIRTDVECIIDPLSNYSLEIPIPPPQQV